MKTKNPADQAIEELTKAATFGGPVTRRLSAVDPARLFRDDAFRVPPSPGQPIIDVAEYSLRAATKTVRTLQKRIREFEQRLDSHTAVMFLLIGGPGGTRFLPTQVTAHDPDKVVFEGLDEERQPFVLVQHVSQLNFAIRAMRLPDDEVRKPIGFEFPTARQRPRGRTPIGPSGTL